MRNNKKLMNRILFVLILLLITGKTIISQEKNEANCSIRKLDKETTMAVEKYLIVQRKLIDLLIAKDCHFYNDSIFVKTEMAYPESKEEFCENITQMVDSIIIELDNGLRWCLNSGPPQEPKWFYYRILSKKGREEQEVIDRIHFLQFCTQFDSSNDKPCLVEDKYRVFTRIKYGEKIILKAVYEIDLKSKQFEIMNLEDIN